jgi:hypothetical protein
METPNEPFEEVREFIYLGKEGTNLSRIDEETKKISDNH